jgi:manganese transport protein
LMTRHYGRWLAVACGALSFTVAAAFQSGNYVACATALESLTGMSVNLWMAFVGVIALIFVFGAKKLYRALEKVMTALVAVMLGCFVLNLTVAVPMFGIALFLVVVFVAGWRMKNASAAMVVKAVSAIAFVALIAATPELAQFVGGLVPKMWLPEDAGLVAGMTATTFSVIAALYQSTLAQQKGWRKEQVGIATREALTGISVLVCVSMMIMMTSAIVLRGEAIVNAAGLAEQLSPLMGGAGKVVFSLGFLAAAFSSTVINAMIGGGLLADGFGLGSDVNSMKNRWFTTLAMAVGLGVGFYGLSNTDPLGAIVWAQRMTILAVPLVAITLVVMANDRRIVGEHRNRPWQNGIAVLAVGVLLWFTKNKVVALLESLQSG